MSQDIRKAFEQAARDVQALPARPDNDDLLELYALYKQAVEGDVKGERPGMLNMVARAKYDAWSTLRGLGAEQAMHRYVDKVSSLRESGGE